jgi:hypothetical protein
MTPAGVPSSISQLAATSASIAIFKTGFILSTISVRSASPTQGGFAGPNGITLGAKDLHSTSCPLVVFCRYTQPEKDHKMLLAQLRWELPPQSPPRITQKRQMLEG